MEGQALGSLSNLQQCGANAWAMEEKQRLRKRLPKLIKAWDFFIRKGNYEDSRYLQK